MVCEKCGKELAEGEVCTCRQDTVNVTPNDVADEAAQTVNPDKPTAAQNDSSSSLPQAGEVAAMAKNAANSFAKNPIVSEFFQLVKGAVVEPVKTTAKSAQRTDILWIIAGIVELLISAAAINMMLRRCLYDIASLSLSNSYYSLYTLTYSEFSESFKEAGLGVFSTYGTLLLCGLITFALAVILIYAAVLLCKKHTAISSAANMLAAAYMPSTLLLVVSMITNLIYTPISVVLGLASIFSFVILAYLGMQKLDKFTKSPFYIYLAYSVIVMILYFVFFIKLGGDLLNEAINNINIF